MNWLVYAILCMIAWGLWGIMIKLASRSMPWYEVYFVSSLASFLIASTIFMIFRGGGVKSYGIFYAILAGVFGGLGYIMFVKALEKGKASIVLPLTALYPAVTVVLAVLLLKEKITLTQVIGIMLAMIAVILLSM